MDMENVHMLYHSNVLNREHYQYKCYITYKLVHINPTCYGWDKEFTV